MNSAFKLTVIFAVMALLFAFALGRSCGVKHGVDIADQKYAQERAARMTIIEGLNKDIADKQKEIGVLEATANGAINSANTVIANKDEEIRIMDLEIVTLREGRDELETWEAIAKSEKRERQIWTDKFYLAQDQLKEKDGIIFQLNQKYDARVKVDLDIIEMWKKKCDEEHTVRMASEKLSLDKTKKIKSMRFENTLAKGVTVVVAGGLIYSLLRK